jgi:hypothetical protein
VGHEGGFSLNADVTVAAWDRAGLERLLRYCARPIFAASLWAMLIARIYEVFSLVCPQCGGELMIVAFLTEADPIQRLLIHIGEPSTPPRIIPARAPPDWLEAQALNSTFSDTEKTSEKPCRKDQHRVWSGMVGPKMVGKWH